MRDAQAVKIQETSYSKGPEQTPRTLCGLLLNLGNRRTKHSGKLAEKTKSRKKSLFKKLAFIDGNLKKRFAAFMLFKDFF